MDHSFPFLPSIVTCCTMPDNNQHSTAASGGQASSALAQVKPPPLNSSFPAAAQPDIIRANQKDLYYRTQLQEEIDYVFRESLGTRRFLRYKAEICTLSDTLYYLLTTIFGSQTLGEEYCDLLQVDTKRSIYPGPMKRFLSILLQVCFPYVITKGMDRFRQRILATEQRLIMSEGGVVLIQYYIHRRSSRDEQWVQKNKQWLERFGWLWKAVLHPSHLAIFYFAGAYYHLSKRLTGIRYIFTRQLLPNEEPMGYEFIGVLMVIQFAVRGLMALRRHLATRNAVELAKDQEVEVAPSTDKMSFLSSGMKDSTITTATPCGHMFCWLCICQWCQTKPECPLCRQPAPLSHLFVVHNA
ncbi:Pex12 amino terminal region-domain-containing protein [Syncephalis plumigaleata]|nr:Pex12 amino terminal region-domain-containing protein [Syncephalis plumigaleata]